MASTSRKPMRTMRDGIAQMVAQAQVTARDGMGPVVLAGTVLHMLRLERRRVRRIIKVERARFRFSDRFDVGVRTALDNLLAAMKETP